MSVYFDKARELAALLLASECSLRLCDAEAAYRSNAVSLAKMEAYQAHQADAQARIDGGLTQQEWDVLQNESAKKLVDLQKDPAIANWLAAEKDFTRLVDQVTAIIRTVIGEDESNCHLSACRASQCQGCSKKGGFHA